MRAAIIAAGVMVSLACGTLPNGRRWGQDATIAPGTDRLLTAGHDAAVDPFTWVPLAGAGVLFVGKDWDAGRVAHGLRRPRRRRRVDRRDHPVLIRDALGASVNIRGAHATAGHRRGAAPFLPSGGRMNVAAGRQLGNYQALAPLGAGCALLGPP
jgi:hypothetical protein